LARLDILHEIDIPQSAAQDCVDVSAVLPGKRFDYALERNSQRIGKGGICHRRCPFLLLYVAWGRFGL
jgi:hypothetical protein